MGSSVGFESASSEEQKGAPRKRMVSRGLSVAAIFLVLILALWGFLKISEGKVKSENVALEEQIKSTNIEIQQKLTESNVSDFAVRAGLLEGELYRGYSTNDVLDEIESIMIYKETDNSGNRVVLKSFGHSAGSHEKKSIGNASAIITSDGNITISADADTFDVMAQQVEEFKGSEYFDNVVVGTTDRDDSGRIIFTLTMDVVGYDRSPYENYNSSETINATIDADNDVFVEINDSAVEVNANSGNEEVNVIVDGDGGVQVDAQSDQGSASVNIDE